MPKNNKMKKMFFCVSFMMVMLFAGCSNNKVEEKPNLPAETVVVQEMTVQESHGTVPVRETVNNDSTTVSTSTTIASSENEVIPTTTITTFAEVTSLVNQPTIVESTVTAVVTSETQISYVETQPIDVSYLTHQVVAGDTWYGIASKYHVSMSDLLAVNNADEDDVILIDQFINIPNYGYYDDTSDYTPAVVETTYSPQYSAGTCLAYQSMTYSNTWNNSWKNIVTSAQYLNGTILYPGDTFSWFSVMGPCDYSQGYIDSDGYAGNQVVQVPGGGICFTSTNLHLCARSAGMEILERHDHSMPVWYAGRGDEASVSYGSWDLRFKNNTGNTVIIYSSTDEYGNLTISMYT